MRASERPEIEVVVAVRNGVVEDIVSAYPFAKVVLVTIDDGEPTVAEYYGVSLIEMPATQYIADTYGCEVQP